MNVNGSNLGISSNGTALQWPGRVVTVHALERQLNGHRHLNVAPGTIITPAAEEYLRGNGVKVSRHSESKPTEVTSWGYTQEAEHPLIQSAVQALNREGIFLQRLTPLKEEQVCQWAKEVAVCVAAGQCCGGLVFCGDPGLFCCVTNKVPGLRAVPVFTVLQAVKATTSLGANLLAVEMPGRTYFEIRQIMRMLCTGANPACPPGVACTLREMDGHAHS